MAVVLAIFLIIADNAKAQYGCTRAGDPCTINNQAGTCQLAGYASWTCVPQGQSISGMTPSGEVKTTTSGGLWNWMGNITFKVIFKLIDGVLYFVFQAFGLLFYVVGALLDFVLTRPELQRFTGAAIVGVGWGIARNTANMFFALILLIISFATILRIESYGIKQVLPRLIIAALLINFSLTIGGVIIDFTQVLTKYFVDLALAGTNGQSISNTIANNMRVTQGILTTAQSSGAPNLSDALDGIAASTIGLFAGIITILIATFTIAAGAFFFVVRYIALLFLLILSPLAWFSYILPRGSTIGAIWNQWWSAFFKWAFFAPAYAFLLYLSLTVIKSGVVTQPVAGPEFGRYTITMIINFIIINGFLLGSLMIAQKTGVMGAGAAMSLVKRTGKGVGKFAARKGTGYDKWAPAAGRIATAAVGVTLAKIPGFRKTGKAFQGKALQMREKQLESKQNKQYETYIKSLPATQRELQLNSAKGQNALIIAKVMKENGEIQHVKAQVVKQAVAAFEAFGRNKDVQDIQKQRPEMSKNIGETIAKTIQEGNLNMVSEISLGNDEVVAAICQDASPKQIESLRDKSPKYEAALKTGLSNVAIANAAAYGAKVAAGTATPAETEQSNKVQFAYASQTGDINHLSHAQAQEWAKKTPAEGLKRIQLLDSSGKPVNFDPNDAKHRAVAENMPASKLVNIIQNVQNDQLAKDIVNYIKTTPSAAGHTIAKNDRYLSNL